MAILAAACSYQPRLPDPIGHVVDVHRRPWSTWLAPDLRVVEAPPPPAEDRRELSTWRDREAYVAADPASSQPADCVYFQRDGRTYRVEGLPPPWRPIGPVCWASERYLVFDRWSQPHYGMHYIVDTQRLKVVHATPFPDEFMLNEDYYAKQLRAKTSQPAGRQE